MPTLPTVLMPCTLVRRGPILQAMHAQHIGSNGARRILLLKPAKGKVYFRLAAGVAMVALAVSMRDQGPIMWFAIILFAIFSGIFVLQAFPGASYLQLLPEGFVIRALYKTSPLLRWESVSEFRVGSLLPWRKAVVFDPTQPHLSRVVPINRNLTGGSGALPDNYGLRPAKLAALLNDWRQNALAVRAETHDDGAGNPYPRL